MISLKNTLFEIADKLNVPLEEGTVGAWTYKKYRDGKLEMWFYKDADSWNVYPAPWNNMWTSYADYNFPIPFIAPPAPFASIFNVANGVSAGVNAKTSKTGIHLRSLGSQQAGEAHNISIYVCGRWK